MTTTPEIIEDRFLKRLRAGIQTQYAGAFLLLPYIQYLNLEENIAFLDMEKKSGIPVLKDLILAVNQKVIGKPRFSKLNTIKDLGLAIASGLPAYPDQSHFHEFLDLPKMLAVDRFIKAIGQRQIEFGYIDGSELACDIHVVKYRGKVDLQKDAIPQQARTDKAIRIYSVVDQGYRNPLYLGCGYPGTRAVEVGQKLVDACLDILPDDKRTKFIFDKWFSVGELLNYINSKGQHFVTLIKRFNNRLQQMENIPIEKFKSITDHMGITHIPVKLRNYQGAVRLVVVEVTINGVRTLLGYLTNDEIEEDIEIVKEYSCRWDVEFFHNEMNYLGFSKLPAYSLNKVLFNLAIQLIAYNAMSAFRANLGEDFIGHNIETIYNLFLNHQALVMLKHKTIVVTLFGHPYEEVLEPIYDNISEKLEQETLDPKISWLGGFPLRFEFR